VYPDLVYFETQGNEHIFTVPEFDGQTLAQRNFIAYASMQRTIKFRGIGGYNSYLNDSRNHLSEWHLWLNYLKTGHSFKRFPAPLFHYLSGDPAQMSGNYETSRENMHLQMAVEIMDGANGIQMNPGKERILLVCQGTEYLDRSKVGFELMLFSKILEMNGKYEVYLFQYDVEIKHFGRNKTMQRLKDMVDLIKPTYIFHPSYKTDIPVSVWAGISENYTTIVWNSDNHRYENFCKEYDKGFRYAITTYKDVYDKMKHPGKILSQWACNKYYFGPKNKDIDVCFCGQKYGERETMLQDSGVECYGNGWRSDSFLDFTAMADVLGRSKISINFSKGGDGGPQIKLRPFETCGSKTLCLCEYVDGIENFFKPNKEIIIFSDRDEMLRVMDYYLNHDAEREAIAQAGYDRVMNEHLFEHRFSAIFSFIDKNNA
jgi:spore maturation protein CgeB